MKKMIAVFGLFLAFNVMANDADFVSGPSHAIELVSDKVGQVIVSKTVSLGNKSNHAIEIDKVEVSCPCLKVKLEHPSIPSGANVDLKLEMQLLDRSLSKEVIVLIKFADQSVGKFSVIGRKKDAFRVFPQPKMVRLGLNRGGKLDLQLLFESGSKSPPDLRVTAQIESVSIEANCEPALKLGSNSWIFPFQLKFPEFNKVGNKQLSIDIEVGEKRLGREVIEIEVIDEAILPDVLWFVDGKTSTCAQITSPLAYGAKGATILCGTTNEPLQLDESANGVIKITMPDSIRNNRMATIAIQLGDGSWHIVSAMIFR